MARRSVSIHLSPPGPAPSIRRRVAICIVAGAVEGVVQFRMVIIEAFGAHSTPRHRPSEVAPIITINTS
jgi:hypothetical protein